MVEEVYPFEGHYFERNGLRLHYLDEGEGDPVVMVHGNPTWSFYYRNVVLALRDTHRCIVPDHIGCGRSDKPDDSNYEYRLQSRVDDLDALLEHLDIRSKVTFIVHDWGGMIGMGYMTRYPDRIQKIVVLNTGAFHLPTTKRFPLALWLGRNTCLGGFLIRRFNAFARIATMVCCKRHPMPTVVKRGYLEPYDSWDNRIATHRFVQDIPLKEGDPSYGLVTEIQNGLAGLKDKPMLICWGEMDFVFDTHFRDEWIRRFPDAVVHSYQDAGHYILEDVTEVIDLVKAFV
ncbi:MAG: alpha/beta fold hydrolase [Planctomycetota bacterium]|nr:alpha/beta fold hydrolase [Planctomycetota bacterium]MDA1142052.1 alpha/beta fold hydrolase [Planctomycetota bacterium]